MKLEEALRIVMGEGDTELVGRPDRLYSRLADLIGADFMERRRLKIFYEVDRQISLIQRLTGKDASEVARISGEFPSLRDVGSRAEFEEIVTAAASVLIEGYAQADPDEPDDFDFGFSDRPEEEAAAEPSVEGCLNDENKLARLTVAELRKYCRTHGLKGYSSCNKAELIDLIMGRKGQAQASSSSQTSYSPTSSPSYYKWYWGIDFWDVLPWIGGALGIAILVAGAVCLGVFADRIQWYEWQHIIGSAGGLVVCGVGGSIVWGLGWLMEDVIVTGFDGYRMAIPIVVVPFAIANFVLMFVFKEAYFIIFYWMIGYLLSASVGGAIYSFTDYESGSGVLAIVDAVAVAGMLAAHILMRVL